MSCDCPHCRVYGPRQKTLKEIVEENNNRIAEETKGMTKRQKFAWHRKQLRELFKAVKIRNSK